MSPGSRPIITGCSTLSRRRRRSHVGVPEYEGRVGGRRHRSSPTQTSTPATDCDAGPNTVASCVTTPLPYGERPGLANEALRAVPKWSFCWGPPHSCDAGAGMQAEVLGSVVSKATVATAEVFLSARSTTLTAMRSVSRSRRGPRAFCTAASSSRRPAGCRCRSPSRPCSPSTPSVSTSGRRVARSGGAPPLAAHPRPCRGARRLRGPPTPPPGSRDSGAQPLPRDELGGRRSARPLGPPAPGHRHQQRPQAAPSRRRRHRHHARGPADGFGPGGPPRHQAGQHPDRQDRLGARRLRAHEGPGQTTIRSDKAGRPGYIAPEVVRGRAYAPAAARYAFGATSLLPPSPHRPASAGIEARPASPYCDGLRRRPGGTRNHVGVGGCGDRHSRSRPRPTRPSPWPTGSPSSARAASTTRRCSVSLAPSGAEEHLAAVLPAAPAVAPSRAGVDRRPSREDRGADSRRQQRSPPSAQGARMHFPGAGAA